MKLLKSALVAGSWFVLSTVYAQSDPSTASNAQAPSQDQRTVSTDASSAAARQSPQAPRKIDECVGPASYCTVFFGGS
jgi:hypothetical protein